MFWLFQWCIFVYKYSVKNLIGFGYSVSETHIMDVVLIVGWFVKVRQIFVEDSFFNGSLVIGFFSVLVIHNFFELLLLLVVLLVFN